MKNHSHFKIFRRSILRQVAVATLGLGLNASKAADANEFTFEINVPPQLLAELKKDSNYSKFSVKGDSESVDLTKGLPIIYIVAGVLAIPELARSLLALYRDYKNGGTIIEVRKGALVITHDSRLDADIIVVKDSTGKITITKNRSTTNLGEWVSILNDAKK